MRAKHFILVPKHTSKMSDWGQGAVPKAHFPLYKGSSPLGPGWHWRSAALESEKDHFHLLVQLRVDKPNFKAWLAVKASEGWAMVARLESHSHAPLHCHSLCGDVNFPVGEIEPTGSTSVPHWKGFHRREHHPMTKQEAWALAAGFFRAQKASKGSLV